MEHQLTPVPADVSSCDCPECREQYNQILAFGTNHDARLFFLWRQAFKKLFADYRFDIPKWFVHIGSWFAKTENPDLKLYFIEYAKKDIKSRFDHDLLNRQQGEGVSLKTLSEAGLAVDEMMMEFERLSGEIKGMTTKKLKPMKWNGSQKELAELFERLKSKGWIDDFEYATIRQCFTPSNSINQYLKPATDKRTKQPQYDAIYATDYDTKFQGIPECK